MKYKWTIVIATIILVGGVFITFNNTKDNKTGDLFSINFVEQTDAQENIKAGNSEGITFENISNVLGALPTKHLLYSNDRYKFSFEYRDGITVSSFREGVGDMVLMQSKDAKTSAQIFIIPFDEKGPITSARILKDLPGLVIKNEKKGVIGGSVAVAFLGKHESLGNTYEIWFVKDESLYQIMTKIETAQFLIDIMKTWKDI